MILIASPTGTTPVLSLPPPPPLSYRSPLFPFFSLSHLIYSHHSVSYHEQWPSKRYPDRKVSTGPTSQLVSVQLSFRWRTRRRRDTSSEVGILNSLRIIGGIMNMVLYLIDIDRVFCVLTSHLVTLVGSRHN